MTGPPVFIFQPKSAQETRATGHTAQGGPGGAGGLRTYRLLSLRQQRPPQAHHLKTNSLLLTARTHAPLNSHPYIHPWINLYAVYIHQIYIPPHHHHTSMHDDEVGGGIFGDGIFGDHPPPMAFMHSSSYLRTHRGDITCTPGVNNGLLKVAQRNA